VLGNVFFYHGKSEQVVAGLTRLFRCAAAWYGSVNASIAQALNDLDDYSSALQDLSEAQQLVAAMEGGEGDGDGDAGVGACVQRELVRLGRRRKKALESEQRLAQAMLQTQTPTEPLPPQGQEQGAKDVNASVWADVALPLEPSWPSFA